MPQDRPMVELLLRADPFHLVLYVFGCFFTLTVLSTGLGFLAERQLPQYRIFAVPLAKGQYRFELIGNLIFLAVATTAVSTALWTHLIRFGEGTRTRGLVTFFGLLVGFQVFYWFLHRLMHTRPVIRVHAWHHRSHVTTPLTG